MNMSQMDYFIMLAKQRNFSKAAAKLYISQPALSKQITVIERKLNMQLFIRDPGALRLTPAGEYLYRELSAIRDNYENVILKAKELNQGYKGELQVGTLEGQRMEKQFMEAFRIMSERHPMVSIGLRYDSFNGLREGLAGGTLDLAVSLDFDLREDEDTEVLEVDECPAYYVLSRLLPIAQKETIGYEDLKSLDFIIPKDSPDGGKKTIEECRSHGFYPNIRHAPNLSTVMLLVEAGLGVGVVNAQSTIIENKMIRCLTEIDMGSGTKTCIGWSKTNSNPALALFVNILLHQTDTVPREDETI